MRTDATFLHLGWGKIEHSYFHFFVLQTFAAAKVHKISEIRKHLFDFVGKSTAFCLVH